MALEYVNMWMRGVAAFHLPFSVAYMYISPIPAHVLPIDSAFSGKFKYLTFWTACIEATYFCFTVVEKVIPGFSDKRKSLKKISDFCFMSIVLPLSSFASFTFWTLFTINRELVMPKAFDEFFPLWLNHSLHTFISVYSILELLTTYHQTLAPIRKHYCGLWSVTVPYLIWCNVVYWKSGLWVYPILAKLNWPCRILFFAANLLASTAFCFGGCYLNSIIWRGKTSSIAEKKKSK